LERDDARRTFAAAFAAKRFDRESPSARFVAAMLADLL
jgi:hypothetical protein